MDLIKIGKITSFHGVKGEIRIKSTFPYKEKAFQVGSNIIIQNEQYQIMSYRVHKDYDMITLKGFSNLNDVLHLKNSLVYKSKEELNLSNQEYTEEELLKCKVKTTTSEEGQVIETLFGSSTNFLIRVRFSNREILIPFQKPFIKEIDMSNHLIVVELVEGM